MPPNAADLERMYEAWVPDTETQTAAVHLRNSGHVENVVIGPQSAAGRVRGRRNASSGFNVRIQFEATPKVPVGFSCRCGKVKPKAGTPEVACEHVAAFLLAVIGKVKEQERAGAPSKPVPKKSEPAEDYAVEVYKFLLDLFEGIGPKRAKAVARVFRTVPDLLGATPAQLRKLPDIGVGMADSLHKALERYQRFGGGIGAAPVVPAIDDEEKPEGPAPERADWLADLAACVDDDAAHIIPEGRRPLVGDLLQVHLTSTIVFFRPKRSSPALRRVFHRLRKEDRDLRTSRRHRLWVTDRKHWPRIIGRLEALGADRENVKLAELPLAGLTFFVDARGSRARLLSQPPGVEEAYPDALRILENAPEHEVEAHTGQRLLSLEAFPYVQEMLTDLGALLIHRRLRPLREITEWAVDDPSDTAPGVPVLRPAPDLAPFLAETLPEGLKSSTTLRPYQWEGVAYIRALDYLAYLGDPPGLGKTLQAIVAALYVPGRVLVVCPAGARNVWKHEITTRTTATVFVARPPMREKPGQEKFIVASYDALLAHREQLPLEDVSLVILDEAHYVKNKDALRTQAVHESLLHVPRRLLLSGTPVMNRTEEVRKQLEFIHPDEWSNEAWFRTRFVAPLQWGTRDVRLAALRRLREYFAGVMLRRQKDEVLSDLPPRHVLVHEIDLPESFRDEYDTEAGLLRDHIILNRDTAFGDDYETTRGRVLRLKHLASQGKADAAEAKAREILSAPGEKVVIFAYYLEHLDELQKRLAEFNPVVIHGGVGDKDREKAVRDFQSDPNVRVFLGQLTAAGTAITLTAARHALFVDLDWNPANHQQAADRIHRIGQTREVFIHQLVAGNTIEDTIVDILQKKSTMTAALLDADEDSPGLLPVQRENQLVARLALEVAMGRPKTRAEIEKELPPDEEFELDL